MADEKVDEFDAGAAAQLSNATAEEFTTTDNASGSQAQGKVVKRRNRRPVVCKPCRERRSKCSREKPCSICEKRNEAHLCVYAEPVDKSGRAAGTRANKTANRAKQLDKLRELEELFKQTFSRGQSQNAPAKDHYNSNQLPTPTNADGDNQGNMLDPASLPHWSSLFQDLRSSMEGYEDALSDVDDGVIASEERPVLLGSSNPPLLSVILRQYLPEKDEVDRRLNEYFNATYMVIPVIHAPTFLDQYNEFETSSDTTDPAWVALLFAILSLSALITGAQGKDSDLIQHDHWVSAASQCLNIAGYTKPKPHLISALLLVAQSQYMRYLDPSREVALIISIVTRLAFQAGIHREPGPSVSPFEGEMRRRVWVMIRHLDRQVACQFGVPASVQSNAADISAPHNLLDSDFNESITELPPSRPPTDLSPINTFVMKNKLMSVFDVIYAHAINILSPADDDDELNDLESLLKSEHGSIPEAFKMKPISLSINDPPHLRMSRITLEFLFQKTMIILHRRRMAKGAQNSYSACTLAAKSIVNTFQELIDAFEPGKLMEGKGWMLSATIVNDFLLACMALAMAALSPHFGAKYADEILNTLEAGRNLCFSLANRSRGASRVLNAINNVFARHGRDATLPLDPRMQQSGYAPAPSYNTNGYATSSSMAPPDQTSPFAPFPTPAPSSALSQERSTTNGPQGQGQMPYASPLTAFWTGAGNSIFEGQPVMPGVIPSTHQQQQIGQSQQGQAFDFNTLPVQGQAGQFGAVADDFARLSAQAGVGDIDWSVFDAYITEY